jgi:outer membrane scaffolding protein for murein synthesis (MipA/OmpV family)
MKIPHWICLLALTVSGISFAEDNTAGSDNNNITRPLWEIGFGAGGGWIPDYPASGQNHFNGLGFPFVVYRGDFLRVGDRRGPVRGRFLNTDRYEFDVSLQAAFPVDSEDNDARRGMPDLDWLLGIGPQLKLKLFNNPGKNRLNLNFPFRAIFSTDLSSFVNRGYVFNPRLTYRHENITDRKLRLFVSAGPVFTTAKLMDYFYTVQPEFATSTRPAFDAKGGYLGSELTLGLTTRHTKKFRLFLGTRLGLYKGATNESSPLFRDELTIGVFTGFIWSLWQSDRRVPDWE